MGIALLNGWTDGSPLPGAIASGVGRPLARAGEALGNGYGLALGLPHSAAGAIALILIVLAIVYALLTVFIRAGIPQPGRLPRQVNDLPDNGEAEPEPAAPTSFGTKEEPYSDWGERSGSPDDDEDYSGPAPEPAPIPEPPEPPIRVEALYVHGVRIALGDSASHVMTAFRPGEGEMTPLIERNARGEACHVTRSYTVGRQSLTLVFAREEPGDLLSLVEILLAK